MDTHGTTILFLLDKSVACVYALLYYYDILYKSHMDIHGTTIYRCLYFCIGLHKNVNVNHFVLHGRFVSMLFRTSRKICVYTISYLMEDLYVYHLVPHLRILRILFHSLCTICMYALLNFVEDLHVFHFFVKIVSLTFCCQMVEVATNVNILI